MNKVIVTLRTAPTVSIEIPTGVERSCFGALRLYPGVPRAITKGELAHLQKAVPGVCARLETKAYVESKRIDVRGASEAEISKLAAAEGLDHLPIDAQLTRLRERGKLPARRAPEEKVRNASLKKRAKKEPT